MPTSPVRAADPVDEHGLVDRARRGDVDAFAVLYRLHVADIHRFSWRRCGSRPAAEDITAVTFEQALRHLDRFEWRGDHSFRRWLFGIAANEAAEHHRRERRHTTDRARAAAGALGPSAAADPEAALMEAVDADRLRAALGRINPRYERALALRYLSDLDPSECAAALGVRTATFAVVLHRADAALRRALISEGARDHER